MEFSEILKEVRTERGISQKELSSMSGLSPQCISAFESGVNNPTGVSLLALANALNISTDFLLGRTDDFGVLHSSAPQLPADELELLRLYRKMSSMEKARFSAYGAGMVGETLSPLQNIEHRRR